MTRKVQNRTGYSLLSISVKTILVHTVTYFVIGFISFTIFDYTAKYADPLLGNYMRQTDHPLVAAGSWFQIVRGFLFALVFYSMREFFFPKKNGWLFMWMMLSIVGILSTFGPTPGSIEGLVYTNVPFYFHIIGLPEVTIQSLLLAFCTHYWVRHPEKKWMAWLFGISFLIALLFATMGILAALGMITVPAG